MTNPAYARLRQRYGDDYETFMMSKLTAVEGDLGRPNMSIADDVRAQLQDKVRIHTSRQSAEAPTGSAPQHAQRASLASSPVNFSLNFH